MDVGKLDGEYVTVGILLGVMVGGSVDSSVGDKEGRLVISCGLKEGEYVFEGAGVKVGCNVGNGAVFS